MFNNQHPPLVITRRELLARCSSGFGLVALNDLQALAANPWDQHGDLERDHKAMGHQFDQPIAALLVDLKQRGLLGETILVFAGEFGRTPFSQGSNGRDHNPFGFSVWLAGGGLKGGAVYGATDVFGYHATKQPKDIYDLWGTVLHPLGTDHEAHTFLQAGRHMAPDGRPWKCH